MMLMDNGTVLNENVNTYLHFSYGKSRNREGTIQDIKKPSNV